MEKQLLEMLTDTKLVQVFDGACFPCNLFFCSCAHAKALCVAYSAFFIRSGGHIGNQACLLYVT